MNIHDLIMPHGYTTIDDLLQLDPNILSAISLWLMDSVLYLHILISGFPWLFNIQRLLIELKLLSCNICGHFMLNVAHPKLGDGGRQADIGFVLTDGYFFF